MAGHRWEKTVSLFWWQDIVHRLLYIGCWHIAFCIGAFLAYFSYSFNAKWQYDPMLWKGMGEWQIPVRILQYAMMSYGVCSSLLLSTWVRILFILISFYKKFSLQFWREIERQNLCCGNRSIPFLRIRVLNGGSVH